MHILFRVLKSANVTVLFGIGLNSVERIHNNLSETMRLALSIIFETFCPFHILLLLVGHHMFIRKRRAPVALSKTMSVCSGLREP